MNRTTAAALGAALVLIPAAGAAQEAERTGFYGSAGYSLLNPKGAPSDDLGAVNLRAGYQANRYFGAEIEGAIGVDDGRLDAAIGGRGQYKLDHFVGVFGVARYPVTDRLDIFARGGVAHARFEGRTGIGAAATRFSDSGGLWGAGAGVQYNIDDQNAVRAEFTRYEGDDRSDFETWGLSFVRRF